MRFIFLISILFFSFLGTAQNERFNIFNSLNSLVVEDGQEQSQPGTPEANDYGDSLIYVNEYTAHLRDDWDSSINAYNCPDENHINFSSGIIYIDPDSPTNGVGTIGDPMNVWPTLAANTAYLQKRGTSIAASGLNSITIDYVLIGAYGIGEDRPIITNTIEIEGEGNVIRNIQAEGHINIADWPYYDAGNCWVYKCECEKIEVFQHDLKIIGNKVHGADTDGLWSSGSDQGHYIYDNEWAYNIVYDVNTNWYPGVSESDAPGDGFQLNINDSVHVHHNIIDRSTTGNKFCGLVGCSDGGRAFALIENNVFFLPMDTPGGGAGIYFTGVIDGIFRNNKFIGEEDNSLSAIYINSNTADVTICGNYFEDTGKTFDNATSIAFNNTLIDVTSHDGANIATCENNIIWGSGSLSSSNLIIDATTQLDTLFVDPTNQDYRIKSTVTLTPVSAYSGTNNSYWIVDANGVNVSSNTAEEYGAFINDGQ